MTSSLFHKSVVLAGLAQLAVVTNVDAANPPPAATVTERFSAGTNSPYSATTIGQFTSDCDLDQASCVAMIGNVLMDRIQFSPTSHVCLPGITYGNAVVPWLKAHPDMANMSVEDGVYQALTTLYKCGPPNNY